MTQPIEYGKEGTRAYSLYYSHTGKVTFAGVVLGALTGMALVVPLAWGHAYLAAAIADDRIVGLCAGVSGAVIGAMSAWTMTKFHVRSISVGMAMIGVVALVAYYVLWAAWMRNILSMYASPKIHLSMWEALADPQRIRFFIMSLYDNGLWQSRQFSDERIKGNELLMGWVIEALIFFGTALVIGRLVLNSKPYCERCGNWCAFGGSRVLVAGEIATVRGALELHDFNVLAPLARAMPREECFWQVDITVCRKCEDFGTLSLSQTDVKIQKKKRTGKTKILINRLIVDRADLLSVNAALSGQPPS